MPKKIDSVPYVVIVMTFPYFEIPPPGTRTMARFRIVLPSALIFLLCFSLSGSGSDFFEKEDRAEKLYDRAVHAFFDQKYDDVIEMLDKIDEMRITDPRPYYFLALAHHRLDNEEKSVETLQKAAKLEWGERGVSDYNVSDAIRRIQGNERIFIEKYRKAAREEWEKAETKRKEAKYRDKKKEGREILEAIRRSASSDLPKPGEPVIGTAPFGAQSLDPFRAAPENEVKPAPKKASPRKRPTTESSDSSLIQTDPDSKPAPKAKPQPKPQSDDEEDPFA